MEVLFIATFEMATVGGARKSYSAELVTLGESSTLPKTFRNWIDSLREQTEEKTGSKPILIHSQIIT